MSLDMAVHSHGIQCSNKKKKRSNTIHYINCFCFYLLFFFFYPNTSPEVLLICNTSISNTILREYNSSNKLIV